MCQILWDLEKKLLILPCKLKNVELALLKTPESQRFLKLTRRFYFLVLPKKYQIYERTR